MEKSVLELAKRLFFERFLLMFCMQSGEYYITGNKKVNAVLTKVTIVLTAFILFRKYGL